MDTDAGEFFEDLDGGLFAQKIGRVLSDVAGAVVDNDKVGKVKIELTFKQIGNGSQVLIGHKLSFNRPLPRGERAESDITQTPMYVGRGGRLSFFPEDQTQMFGKQGEPATDK